jgi:lysophospholipase L1-like esterase
MPTLLIFLMNSRSFSRRLSSLFAALLLFPSLALPLFAQRPEDKALPPPAPVHAEFKFDFGPGKAREGFTPVSADMSYSTERGFGFDFSSRPVGVEGSGTDALTDGSIGTMEPPFFFSVKVPEGNYRVTVTLGDGRFKSDTTIRSEAGHLLAARITTAPGQFVTRTFYANVRRPQIPPPPKNAPGGTEVHMFLAGEPEARAWDEKLTLEFNGPSPSVSAIEIVKDDAVPTLFVAGDSTVGDPRRGPGGNWPTQMCQFFKPEIAVCNSAEGGETTKSFITGYRFDKVLSQMKAGDFFLIQFGHNDSKANWPQSYTDPGTSFNAYLRVFIAETRRRGATLVLVTPMERSDNQDSVGRWARAMRQVAAEEKVPLIDQWAMSKQLWTALGENVTRAFNPNDRTHLSGYGGYLLSKVIVAGIKQTVPELARYVADDFQPMDLAHPDAPPEYLRQSPGVGVPVRAPRNTNAAPASAIPATEKAP